MTVFGETSRSFARCARKSATSLGGSPSASAASASPVMRATLAQATRRAREHVVVAPRAHVRQRALGELLALAPLVLHALPAARRPGRSSRSSAGSASGPPRADSDRARRASWSAAECTGSSPREHAREVDAGEQPGRRALGVALDAGELAGEQRRRRRRAARGAARARPAS